MPDYTSILRRSIAALPDPSPEMRAVVYQRARAALARQLTAVDPPLSTREIETQHQDLEDAVAKLEADYTTDEASEAESPEASSDTDAYRSVSPADAEAARETARPAEENQFDDAPPEFNDGADEDDEEEEFDDEERGSRLPLIVGGLVLLLVIVGVGAYLYAERDRIAGFFTSEEPELAVAAPPTPVSVVPPSGPDPAPAADPNKLPDRLTNGAEPPPAAEAPPADVAAAEPEIPLQLPANEEEPVPPLVDVPAETPPEAAGEAPPAEAPGAPAAGAPPVAPSAPPAEQQTAALQQPGQSIVAQRAIFYFKGTEGSPARQVDGTATWAEITRDNAPAIQATLRLADQETTTITIYKNNDASLPASHLVEVQFSGELGTSPVQRVPALVLKPTEQARGEPLTGAAVPVTSELFWLALSDDQERVTRNLQLLREGSWFDLPILFDDGAQGLLTFEKGIPGDRVFETVMSTWVPG